MKSKFSTPLAARSAVSDSSAARKWFHVRPHPVQHPRARKTQTRVTTLRFACPWLVSAALAMSLEAGAAAEVHPDRKRVLILGDSISIGYTPFVRETLQADAVVVRPILSDGQPENCDGTTRGVQEIDRWLRLDGG